MKITSIPQIYRNLNRWREIVQVLSKHGVANLLSGIELPFSGVLFGGKTPEPTQSIGRDARIRMALEELGPTFVKLGQVLSTRPDLVGPELAGELAKLQSSAPSDPADVVRRIVEEDLQQTIEECFEAFEPLPIASASIGQVHRARTLDRRDVAVKVLHAGIHQRVLVDTDILVGIGQLAERLPELASYRPASVAEEFQKAIRRELDFTHERRRIEQFAARFEGDRRVRIPAPVAELSARRVLTMEWLEGMKFSDPRLAESGPSALSRLASVGADVFLDMVFRHGAYHADPHPGNLLALPNGAIGLLDFGMVGRLSETLREDLEEMLLSVGAGDAPRLAALVGRMGSTPSDLNEDALTADLEDFIDSYAAQPLGSIALADALADLVRIIRRYQMTLPASVAMLLKLMVMLEGTARLLSPDFSLLAVVESHKHRMIRRRLSPARQVRRVARIFGEVERLAEAAPRRLRDILRQVETGTFDVHLDHRGLEPSVNRLVLGMLSSALFLGSSLLVSGGVWPVYGVSAPGAIGFALSGYLGLRVLRAIGNSGRLEREKPRNQGPL